MDKETFYRDLSADCWKRAGECRAKNGENCNIALHLQSCADHAENVADHYRDVKADIERLADAQNRVIAELDRQLSTIHGNEFANKVTP